MKPKTFHYFFKPRPGAHVIAELSVEIVDCGIGAYEFWGCKGNDTNLQPEISFSRLIDYGGMTKEEAEEAAENLCESAPDDLVKKAWELFPPERDEDWPEERPEESV